MFVQSQGLDDLGRSRDASGDGRPQSDDEKKGRRRKRRRCECQAERRVKPKIAARTHEKNGADDDAHGQQSDAWPTAGECGIEPSQSSTFIQLSRGDDGRDALNGLPV
jgi:hypothetical protein